MEHPMRQTAIPVTPRSGESDAALVERARRGEGGAFEAIMRRYNRRLFRIAHGILKNAGEAEDAVQEAYVRVFTRRSEERRVGKECVSTRRSRWSRYLKKKDILISFILIINRTLSHDPPPNI